MVLFNMSKEMSVIMPDDSLPSTMTSHVIDNFVKNLSHSFTVNVHPFRGGKIAPVFAYPSLSCML